MPNQMKYKENKLSDANIVRKPCCGQWGWVTKPCSVCE